LLNLELVLQRALDSFIQNDEAKLCAFLLAGAREPLISSLRGNLFEALANRKIASGGTFNIRSLDDDNAASYHVNLPPRSQIRFKSIEECQNQNSLFIAA
jgi:hypothetical protein